MTNQAEILSEFANGRREFILDGLRRFGKKGTNPFSGTTYGEMVRAFNDFHPMHRIEEEKRGC